MNARNIDIFTLAQSDKVFEGTLSLSDFDRLSEELEGTKKAAEVTYRVEATQGKRGLPAVLLTLRAKLTTQCVYCAEPVFVHIDKALAFLLTQSEEEADALPIEEDGDFDVIVGSQHFDWKSWIEDELILSLPAFPRHDACSNTELESSNEKEHVESEPNRPFAELKNLMRN